MSDNVPSVFREGEFGRYFRIIVITDRAMAKDEGLSIEDARLILEWMERPRIRLQTGENAYLIDFESND